MQQGLSEDWKGIIVMEVNVEWGLGVRKLRRNRGGRQENRGRRGNKTGELRMRLR